MKKLSHKKLAEHLFEALEGLNEKERAQVMENFTLYLAKQGKLAQGEKIIAAFEEVVKEKEGYRRYEVVTRYPLQKELKKELQKVLGEKAEIAEATDESILGGMILKSKNTIYDASLKTALHQLKNTLNN